MFRDSYPAGLQGIFALPTDQSGLRPIQYESKSAQFLCKVAFIHQAPRVPAMNASLAGHCVASSVWFCPGWRVVHLLDGCSTIR